MPESAFVSMVPEIKQRATDRSLDVSLRIIQSQLGVYDEPLDRGERILRFLDFSHSGVLDILGTVKPKLQAQLISTYRRDMAQEMRVQHGHGDLSQQEGDNGSVDGSSTEIERTFAIDPDLLPRAQMQGPWPIVQGYLSREHSIRLFPATQTAYERHKSAGMMMARHKEVHQIPYDRGVAEVMKAPTVAVKDRYLIRDQQSGRAWALDHQLNNGQWVAETEFKSEAEANALQGLPSWASSDLTHDPHGYTVNVARPMAPQRVQAEIQSAAQRGLKTPCPLSQDPNFEWDNAA